MYIDKREYSKKYSRQIKFRIIKINLK